MAAFFTAASSQYLKNATAPVTAAPFTVAFWFRMPTSGSYQILWGLGQSGGTTNDYYVAKATDNRITWNADQTSGSFFELFCTTAITSNAWTFGVFRAITTANHRASLLHPNGTIDHVQDTTTITPTGLDTEGIGAIANASPGSFMDGSIAERSLWNADIQADNAQLLDSTLRQMAYGGPFSLPHMLGNLVDYQSFRSGITTDRSRIGEVYSGGAGRQIWTNTNGATLGPHPPLPYWYAKPAQAPRALVV